jgi:hypothetical protein
MGINFKKKKRNSRKIFLIGWTVLQRESIQVHKGSCIFFQKKEKEIHFFITNKKEKELGVFC